MFFTAMLLATAEPSMQAIVEPAGGTVGFAAVELSSGRSLGLKQNEPFPMQERIQVADCHRGVAPDWRQRLWVAPYAGRV
jgi:hypothetical protein